MAVAIAEKLIIMIQIASDIYRQIEQTIGSFPSEQGGILGVNFNSSLFLERTDTVITAYYFDKTGHSTSSSYTPDYLSLNRILENVWAKEGILLAGIIHSHTSDCPFPSCGDLQYTGAIMDAAGMTEFLLPIVCIEPFAIYGYRIETEGHVRRVVQDDVICI